MKGPGKPRGGEPGTTRQGFPVIDEAGRPTGLLMGRNSYMLASRLRWRLSSGHPPLPLPTVFYVSTNSMARMYFTMVKPYCVSRRSLSGAPCSMERGSPFMS